MIEKVYVVYGYDEIECATKEEALEAAQEDLDTCRENCDPEWPMSTEDITVYLCPVGYEDTDDCTVIYYIEKVPLEAPDQDDGIEYCDYKLVEKIDDDQTGTAAPCPDQGIT